MWVRCKFEWLHDILVDKHCMQLQAGHIPHINSSWLRLTFSCQEVRIERPFSQRATSRWSLQTCLLISGTEESLDFFFAGTWDFNLLWLSWQIFIAVCQVAIRSELFTADLLAENHRWRPFKRSLNNWYVLKFTKLSLSQVIVQAKIYVVHATGDYLLGRWHW